MIISVDIEKNKKYSWQTINRKEFPQCDIGFLQTSTKSITFNGEIWKVCNLKLPSR